MPRQGTEVDCNSGPDVLAAASDDEVDDDNHDDDNDYDDELLEGYYLRHQNES